MWNSKLSSIKYNKNKRPMNSITSRYDDFNLMKLHVLIMGGFCVDVRSLRYIICFSVARHDETVVDMSLFISLQEQQHHKTHKRFVFSLILSCTDASRSKPLNVSRKWPIFSRKLHRYRQSRLSFAEISNRSVSCFEELS